MGTSTNDDEECFNREARRRIKLHRDKSADKDLAGNRIVIIGYDGNESAGPGWGTGQEGSRGSSQKV